MLITLLLGYLLMALLFYIEYRYESSRSTTMLQTSGDDQGTTTLLFIAWIIAIVSSTLLGLFGQWWSVMWWLQWLGLGWILGGLCLLRWAMMMNPFYIRPMATTDDQFLCTNGPYKVIRHPGYVAFYLGWLGLGLASGSGVSVLLVAIVVGYAYVKRIRAEEQMMLEHFGVDYQHYANESFRVLPFVY